MAFCDQCYEIAPNEIDGASFCNGHALLIWQKRCLAAEACNVQFGDVLRRADALIGDLKVRCLAAEEASRRGARAMMKVSKDDNYVERRFPTKAARKIADEAIDKLDEHEDMRTYLDVWLAAYRKAGGVEKKI